jgi:16S rRNA (adenine1518-N6/adenine1519-N6)-dimethyltransferase
VKPRELREAGLTPVKSLGQHFLTDWSVVQRIIAAAKLSSDDTVIEVGPGLGVLTGRLAAVAGRVIAIEVDPELRERLEQRFATVPNLAIVEEDVLETDPAELLESLGLEPEAPYGVVGNLPYNIGSAVLRHFLEASVRPRFLVVMLQREVAESICASPGDLGILGISAQVYAQPRRLFSVPAKAFYPPPKVTSSVIRLDVRPEPLVPDEERERFFEVVKAGFSAPRKQLRNSLAQGLRRSPGEVEEAIRAEGLDPTQRPEELAIEAWRRLARRI